MRRLVLGFLGVCICVALWGVTEVWVEVRSLGWRQVPAHVTQSDVRLAAVYRSVTRSARPVDSNWYEWNFQYRYRVDGIEYTSDRLGFVVTPYWNHDSALEIAARYPAGAAVLAYVSPDDPAFAVLQPGPSFPTLLLLGSAILAAMGAAWMLPGVAPRKSRHR